jgi:hypothetical protein
MKGKMPPKRIEVKRVTVKAQDLYRTETKEKELKEMMHHHELYEYHNKGQVDPSSDEWLRHSFFFLLTKYNLHFVEPQVFPVIDRKLVYEAHVAWQEKLRSIGVVIPEQI